MGTIFVDTFSGLASELRGHRRTPADVLSVLRSHPRISTFDMSEHRWLRECVEELIAAGRIREAKHEPYPWHRYEVLS